MRVEQRREEASSGSLCAGGPARKRRRTPAEASAEREPPRASTPQPRCVDRQSATGIGAQTLQQIPPDAKRVPEGGTGGWTHARGARHTPAVPAARILRLDDVDPVRARRRRARARALRRRRRCSISSSSSPGAVVPEHSHPHEQMGIVISGEIVMIIDGEERPCHAMDAMHIPSGVVHARLRRTRGRGGAGRLRADPRGLPRAGRRPRSRFRPTNARAREATHAHHPPEDLRGAAE